MSESRFMETVLFGGYERSAVEKKFAELTEQVFSLENELQESKELLSALEKGDDAAKTAEKILKSERAKLTELQTENAAYAEKIRVLEEDLAARDEELASLKAKCKRLQLDLDDKSLKLTAIEAQGDAEALSAVFIEAQKSADLLRDMAKKEATALESNSKKLADNLIAEANNTVKKLVYEAEKRSAELVADAENRHAQMEAASENLRATALADVQKLAEQIAMLKQVFDTFQNNGINALADAETLLNETRESMEAGGVPVFREPILTVPAVPSPPAVEPVDHTYYNEPEEPAQNPAEKQQMNDELKRLQAMADSLISSGKKEPPAPEKEEKKKESSQKHDPIKAIVPDLAALAAQADALANGKK